MSDNATSLSGLVGSLAGRRVLVVGDLLADQFLCGEISRVSREAPVLILRHERTETVPGGGANCVMNLAALGARAAVVGVVGADEAGRALTDRLAQAGVDCTGVLRVEGARTTTKVRVLAGHAHAPRQQVIRVDYEDAAAHGPELLARIEGLVRERFAEADAAVVSDYGYGVAAGGAVEFLRAAARGGAKPVLVDSRFRLAEFGGFTSATPNEDEVEQVAGRRLGGDEEVEAAGAELRERLGHRALLVTRGKHGMVLFEEGRAALHLPAVGAHDAVDVTGAGDTVIATYALALAAGAGFAPAARLANHAGGLVVLKRGTATVTPAELLASLAQAGEG